MLTFKEYLKKLQEETLNESKLLTSDFTFGFEFETCVKEGTYLYGKSYDEINSILTKDLIDGIQPSDIYTDSKCGVDSSIKPKRKKDKSFEYDSPAFACKPYIFKKVIKCLEKWNSVKEAYGCYTNSSCGFHNHLKFNGITQQDLIWIYANIATDIKFAEKFLSFIGAAARGGKSINKNYIFFNNKYAKKDELENISDAINLLGTKYDHGASLSTIKTKLFSTEKYRNFRIHPQGTLEWRGPRDFMNNNNIMSIKSFYLKLIDMIAHFRKYIDSDILIGYHQDENLIKNLKLSKEEENEFRNQTLTKSEFFELIKVTKYQRPLDSVDLPSELKIAKNKKVDKLLNIYSNDNLKFKEDFLNETKDFNDILNHINTILKNFDYDINNENVRKYLHKIDQFIFRSIKYFLDKNDYKAVDKIFTNLKEKYMNNYGGIYFRDNCIARNIEYIIDSFITYESEESEEDLFEQIKHNFSDVDFVITIIDNIYNKTILSFYDIILKIKHLLSISDHIKILNHILHNMEYGNSIFTNIIEYSSLQDIDTMMKKYSYSEEEYINFWYEIFDNFKEIFVTKNLINFNQFHNNEKSFIGIISKNEKKYKDMILYLLINSPYYKTNSGKLIINFFINNLNKKLITDSELITLFTKRPDMCESSIMRDLFLRLKSVDKDLYDKLKNNVNK